MSDLIKRSDLLRILKNNEPMNWRDTDEEITERACWHWFNKIVEEADAVDAVEVDKVAQMFFDFTGDDCPCNYVGVDEWLPEVCELQKECPRPADGLGCWKQFVKHYGERREEKE